MHRNRPFEHICSVDREFLRKEITKQLIKEKKIMSNETVEFANENKDLNTDNTPVDIDKIACDVCEKITPYVICDISSGEFTGIFQCPNVQTAVRSFCESMDRMPERYVKDAILVNYDSKEVVFEGKNYIEEWNKVQERNAQLNAMRQRPAFTAPVQPLTQVPQKKHGFFKRG